MPKKLVSIKLEDSLEEVVKEKLSEDFFKKTPIQLREYSETVGIALQADEIDAVLNNLKKAKKNGLSFDEWKETFSTELNEQNIYNEETVFRTNIQSAYNASIFKKSSENKDKRPYLQYDAINDSRTRPSHLALDGIIRTINSSFWKECLPPNGFNCRCTVKSMTQKQALDRSSRSAGTGIYKRKRNGPCNDKGFEKEGIELSADSLEKYAKERFNNLPSKIKRAFATRLRDTRPRASLWYDRNKDIFDRFLKKFEKNNKKGR
jgi:SPP1 gp7 family putative phage head morphogenesis protein